MNEELLERIKTLDVSTIEKMSPEVMSSLTDKFKEPYVRALVLQSGLNIHQRRIIKAIKEKYREWYKGNIPYWASSAPEAFGFRESYPQYMTNLQMDIECGYIVTEEGSAPPQRATLKVTPVLDDSKMIKHTESDIKEPPTDTETNNKQLEELHARIKELEAEVERLRTENEQLKEEKSTLKSHEQLKGQVELLEATLEDVLVEALAPAFYNDKVESRRFLKETSGMDAEEIAEVAGQFLDNRKIVPSKCKRNIWKFIHAAKRYDKTEQNWSAAMRKFE